MSERVDIKGLPKGALLKALHDGTKPLRMGYLHAVESLSLEIANRDYTSAEEHGKKYQLKPDGTPEVFFDYYCGRPLKVDLGGDSFNPYLYDRDAPGGQDAAAKIIEQLRAQLGTADAKPAA